MKKSGFTLIETMASLTVILIIFSGVISISKVGMEVIDDIKVRSCAYDVQNLLTYAKSKCRNDSKFGKIIINYRNNTVNFKEDDNGVVKVVRAPENAKLMTERNNANMEDKIGVSDEGKIEQGYTLSVFDNKSMRYDVTIGVGIDNITIKEVEI